MTTNGSTAIVMRPEPAATLTAPRSQAFEPGSFAEAVTICATLFRSRLLPKHIQSPEAAVTIVMAGRELGFSTMVSLRGIWMIDGKITLSADLIVAAVKRSGECEYFQVIESTDKIATYETKRRGNPKPTRMSFTIEEAQRAKLTGKDNWNKYPAAMLRARCASALARAEYPDAVAGVYDPDELEREPAQRVQYERAPAAGEVHDAQPAGPSYDELRRGIVEARTLADLRSAGAAVKNAFGSGAISDEERLRLAGDYEARKRSLSQDDFIAKRRAEEQADAPSPAVDDPYAPRDEEQEQ